jgi:hypothetical protein
MNLNSKKLSNDYLNRLLKTKTLFLQKFNKSEEAKPSKKFRIVKPTQKRSSAIHRPINPQPETHPLKRINKEQLDFKFFKPFSKSFNLMEPFIKAQSANDLVIALCSLEKNLEEDFQEERSGDMLKHLNSNEGRIFLKHKIDRIIDDTTKQILRDPHLNSSDSGKGSAADDDLTKSAGNIATKNESEETTPNDDLNSIDQKLSSVIKLFNTFIASGLKHSARDLLLGMDKDFSEKLALNPSSIIASDRPSMIIDTVQDPKKSGIESKPLIKSNWDFSGNKVINLPETLESFTDNYILTKKINREPVDKEIQPYLNKVIKDLNYQYVYSDSATQFYLKAIQKGYVKEANDFLTHAIQDGFKAFVPTDVFLKQPNDTEEFDEFIDLLKWATDKKFLPKQDLQKTLLSLIAETNKHLNKPNELMELRSKYKLLEPLLDKLHDTYRNGNSADERRIKYYAQEIKRANNQQDKLKKSIPESWQERDLLKRSLSQKADCTQLPEEEKTHSQKGLSEMTVPEFLEQLGISSKSQVKTEPSKEVSTPRIREPLFEKV